MFLLIQKYWKHGLCVVAGIAAIFVILALYNYSSEYIKYFVSVSELSKEAKELNERISKLQINLDELNKQINENVKVTAELKEKVDGINKNPPKIPSNYDSKCKDCVNTFLTTYEYSFKASKEGEWTYYNKNVFDKTSTGELTILDGFTLNKRYKECQKIASECSGSLNDCNETLKKYKPSISDYFSVGKPAVEVGFGVNGSGWVSSDIYLLQAGKKVKFSVGIQGRIEVPYTYGISQNEGILWNAGPVVRIGY